MARDLLRGWLERTGDGVAVLVAAAIMLASAGDHVYLWDIAYRHVATLGPLFLAQAIAAVVLALVLAVTRVVIVLVGSVLLMLGTIGGFVIAATGHLFGFHLPSNDITQYAYLALSSEAASSLILVAVLIRQARAARPIVSA